MPPFKNLKHEAYLQKLTDPSYPETFGNKSRAWHAVSSNSTLESSRREASRALTNVDTQARYLELMEKRGLTDELFDKEHLKLIKNGDNNIKLKAIRMGHELKGRLGNRGTQNITQNNITQNNLNLQPIDNKEVMSKLDDMLG